MLRNLNYRWLRSRTVDVFIGAVMIGSSVRIAPSFFLLDVDSMVGPLLLFWGLSHWMSVIHSFVRKDMNDWSETELDQLREIAAKGWILFPDDDGGYMAFGPEGERQWLDHWVDVEERFELTAVPSPNRWKRYAMHFLFGGLVFYLAMLVLALIDRSV